MEITGKVLPLMLLNLSKALDRPDASLELLRSAAQELLAQQESKSNQNPDQEVDMDIDEEIIIRKDLTEQENLYLDELKVEIKHIEEKLTPSPPQQPDNKMCKSKGINDCSYYTLHPQHYEASKIPKCTTTKRIDAIKMIQKRNFIPHYQKYKRNVLKYSNFLEE